MMHRSARSSPISGELAAIPIVRRWCTTSSPESPESCDVSSGRRRRRPRLDPSRDLPLLRIPTASTRAGMGAVPFVGGTMFRVWAPHAERVNVIGTWNDWDAGRDALARDPSDYGTWSGDVPGAVAGHEYRFVIGTPGGDLHRIDPRAPRLTNSVGNAIIHDPDAFDWGDARFEPPPWNDLV